jgi:energy-coupling factor transport system substrate-specific component
VTWQVAAFALLGLALGAGFWWYERARPDARIVALVGTLAAFAALGRIAFAAVPNVKPTTDIVLISGYALGAGPGFAVGALAGLTSNFFFGQGPWTPWQMAAWGATGIIGAGLAWALRGRPIGRWPLALICCVVGFGFTVMQDVGDWVTYSDHSSAQLLAYVGQGLGFDAVHAVGCLLFALALGPALARSIQRFTQRLQVTWVAPGGVAAPVVAALVLAGGIGLVGPRTARAAGSSTGAPAGYLLRAQNSDGGFGSAPGQPSAQLYAGWAALGLASTGRELEHVGRLIDYLHSGAGATGDVGSLERTILVVRAAGLSARTFAEHDLVAELEHRVRSDGSVSEQVNLTAFAVMALRSAGVRPGARSRRWLVRQQDSDGGYGFAGAGSQSDSDDTGAALEALAGDGSAAAGARRRAVAYLRHQQNRDGGFPSQPGASSNAQSTAWAVQGLDAAGVAPSSVHRAGAVSPLVYLRSLIAPGGEIRYARGDTQTPVWVTGEALMALAGKPLPLAAPALRSSPGPSSAGPATPASGGSGAASSSSASAAGKASSRARRHRASAALRAAGRTHQRSQLSAAGATGQADELVNTVAVVTALALAPMGLG